MKTHSRKSPGPSPSRSAETPRIDPKWKWHYQALTRLRDQLLQETSAQLQDVAGGLEAHSMHPADSATDEFDHDLALTLLAREQDALNEVNEALERILQGTYGHCLATQAPIPAQRLRALPWCRFTREVEEQLETAGTVRRRKMPEASTTRHSRPKIPGAGQLARDGTELNLVDEPPEPKGDKAVPDEGERPGENS